MKILCVCDIGANRSVTLAHQLRFMNHDVLTAGLKTNSPETLILLIDWADKVIVTDGRQHEALAILGGVEKVAWWNIGPDVYPRPFNKELLKIVKRLIAEHHHELEQI